MSFSVFYDGQIIERFEAPSCGEAVGVARERCESRGIQRGFSLIGPWGYLVSLSDPEETEVWIQRANYFRV